MTITFTLGWWLLPFLSWVCFCTAFVFEMTERKASDFGEALFVCGMGCLLMLLARFLP